MRHRYHSAGAGNDVIRLSVGIETAADLVPDLDRALADPPGDLVGRWATVRRHRYGCAVRLRSGGGWNGR